MNVLWIMTDQLRADCLGYIGHLSVQTPNIDALADKSFVFENAFVQSSVCMASRGSMLTGRYPSTIKVHGMGILPPSEITIAETLQRNGYITGAYGKTHLTPEDYTRDVLEQDVPNLNWRSFIDEAHFPPILKDICKENYGFMEHIGADDRNQGEFFEWIRNIKPDLLDVPKVIPFPDVPRGKEIFISPYPSAYHQTTFVAKKTQEFITRNHGASPWFGFCSFQAPHHPFQAPQDQIDKYPIADIPLPEKKGGVDKDSIPYPVSTAIGEMNLYSEEVQRTVIQHYFASISLIDDCVGSLVKSLKETGQYEDTIIIFTSDHGEFLGNHELFRKPTVHYDELLKVPLVLHIPDQVQHARRINDLVELVDLYPTLLSFLDIPHNPGLQGMDHMQALKKGKSLGREDIWSDMYDMPERAYKAVQTLRTTKWKLNVYPTSSRKYGQLYDLQNDPDESFNLYNDPNCRDIKDDLLWRLHKRAFAQKDPLPVMLTQV